MQTLFWLICCVEVKPEWFVGCVCRTVWVIITAQIFHIFGDPGSPHFSFLAALQHSHPSCVNW